MPRTRDGRGVAYASSPTLARSVTASHNPSRVRDEGVHHHHRHDDEDDADFDFDRSGHNSRGAVLPPTPREIARCLRMHCDCDDSPIADDGRGVGLGSAARLLRDAASMVRIPRSILDFPPMSSSRRRGRGRFPPRDDDEDGEDDDGSRRRRVVRGRYDQLASGRFCVLVGEAVEDLVMVDLNGGDPRKGCDIMARRAMAAAETLVDERLESLGLILRRGRGPNKNEDGNGRKRRRRRRSRDDDRGSGRRNQDVLIGRKRRRRVRPRAYWTVGRDSGDDEGNDEDEADANEKASSHPERRSERIRTAPRDYWTASSPSASKTDATTPTSDDDGRDEEAPPNTEEERELLRIRRGNAVTDILTLLLECLQLASAPHHNRWRSWGRKRTYEVYSLPSPVRPLLMSSSGGGENEKNRRLDAVRDALEREFAHYYFSSPSSPSGAGKNKNSKNRGRKPSTPRPSGCCRVNALLVPSSHGPDDSSNPSLERSNLLYLQLNLSDPNTLALESPSTRHSRTGVRRTNRGDRYLCVMKPGCDLVVLTAGRSPGRLMGRTPFVLATIVGALCCTTGSSEDLSPSSGGEEHRTCTGGSRRDDGRMGRGTVCTKEYASSMRFMNMSGTDPLYLLSSALSHRSMSAVGRYARLAERVSSVGGGGVVDGGRVAVDSLVDCGRGVTAAASTTGVDRDRATRTSDPLVELEAAATGPLYERAGEVDRLRTASRHGTGVAALSASVADATGGTSSLVAVTSGLSEGGRRGSAPAPGVIVDHGASIRAMRDGAADLELGGPGDCPARQRVCWKWTGRTRAASDCWGDGADRGDGGRGFGEEEDGCVAAMTPSKEPFEFKCGVVFEGPNVFDGLRYLVASGLADTPLPDFVRDAPMMGSNVIAVHNGKRVFGSGDDYAAV